MSGRKSRTRSGRVASPRALRGRRIRRWAFCRCKSVSSAGRSLGGLLQVLLLCGAPDPSLALCGASAHSPGSHTISHRYLSCVPRLRTSQMRGCTVRSIPVAAKVLRASDTWHGHGRAREGAAPTFHRWGSAASVPAHSTALLFAWFPSLKSNPLRSYTWHLALVTRGAFFGGLHQAPAAHC